MTSDHSLMFYMLMGAMSSILGSLILETIQSKSLNDIPVGATTIWILAILILMKQINAKAITIEV